MQGKTELHLTGGRARGTASIAPLLGPLQGSLQVSIILPVLNCPLAQPLQKLHWPGEIGPLHLMLPWGPTLPSPQIAYSGPLPRPLHSPTLCLP